jgi:hypothetical protein
MYVITYLDGGMLYANVAFVTEELALKYCTEHGLTLDEKFGEPYGEVTIVKLAVIE